VSSSLRLVATRDMAPGEEVTVCYGYGDGGDAPALLLRFGFVPASFRGRNSQVGRAKYCSPHHRMPFNSTSERSKHESMMWRDTRMTKCAKSRSDLVTLSAKSSKWTVLIGRAGRLSTLSD
jgi:hypothetical protein